MAVAAPNLAYPIATLREHVTALEAAITLALADPKPKAVHRLRTSTRRIEALLILLDLLPGLPDHAKPVRKAAKLLKKLRRAAGAVRDLDVQQDLVPTLLPRADRHDTGTAASDASPASDANSTSEEHTDTDHSRHHQDRLHRHAKRLTDTLDRRREQEAAALLTTLVKLQSQLAPALEHLLDTLAPAADLSISPEELTALTRDWYRHHLPASARILTTGNPRLLHEVRKTAKLARYIAEIAAQSTPSTQSAPALRTPLLTHRANHRPVAAKTPQQPGTSPAQIASEFEAVQQSGGAWHDLLTLADIARVHLGKRSPLTRHLEAARDGALEQYRHDFRKHRKNTGS